MPKCKGPEEKYKLHFWKKSWTSKHVEKYLWKKFSHIIFWMLYYCTNNESNCKNMMWFLQFSFELHSEDRPRDFFRSRVTLKRKILLVSISRHSSFTFQVHSDNVIWLILFLGGSSLLFPIRDCQFCQDLVFFMLGF